ncbi:MAG: class I SAM-dependent methyltransferase [Acidobacteriia bacterium]|nr:class I SAM-dependent methyltransferase [Terriglobia bacterium]MYG03732.1 class I SAM-dependent methyltransferase [Terriglobia bacterium]MYK10769.1 class I SAM-dependent methyltransferase [Terriglobia bacterium]
MAEYDSIASGYSDSKQLPFRVHIERYTLFQTLGDVRGADVLDLACGDGFYTRLLKEAGASSVTGVDLSAEMIRLAEESERRRPLGCSYVRADAASFRPSEPVDLVVAAFLLNYARTREELLRLCRVCRDSLRPGGRFVGLNDNPRVPPDGSASCLKYGFDRRCDGLPLRDGDPIHYAFPTADGSSFGFTNYYHSPATYQAVFRDAGFRDFRWVPVALDPAQAGDPFWGDFMRSPPITAFSAEP